MPSVVETTTATASASDVTIEVPFSLEHFHQLDFPKRTLKSLKPKWMSATHKIHPVFLTHDMHSQFVLALVHRHHDLQQDELLVEVMDADKSVTSVEIPSPNDELLPHIWEVHDGKLHPFEYLNLTKSSLVDAAACRAAYAKLMTSGEFVSELSQVLRETDTSHSLGLQLIHRDILLRPGELLSESSVNKQSIVVSTATPPSCNVPVSWKMGPDVQFCENCIPDWETCGENEDPDMEMPRKFACANSNCGCGSSCDWRDGWHYRSGC